MDSSSSLPLPGSPLPLNPLDFPNFPPFPLSEELKFLCPDLTLPPDFYNVGSPSAMDPQVSSDFSFPGSKDAVFPFDPAVSVEDLEFIDAQLEFRVHDNVLQGDIFPQDPNVGPFESGESNLTPQNPVQSAEFKDLGKSQKINGLREGKKALKVATVSVDMIRNRRPFKCMHGGCEKTFKNAQTLSMHYRTHDKNMSDVLATSAVKAGQNKKIPCRCPVCGRIFVGLYELRRHFGRKHSEGEKMHNCKKCGKKFYIEVDLRDHEKLCGEMVGCKCGLKFAFKCNLQAHKRTHPECVGKPSNSPENRNVEKDQSSTTPSLGLMGMRLEDIWALGCRARLDALLPAVVKK
ncbi:zinc finger protein ENHYDROUS [Cocos nucifera]|uniref:Zinc finger protein ENHYDROUS n=1 Tax=Cocos nucifera TaxID=13894 RepID=A0A8K0IRL6_COCNU|nr:zinc finger protein ENHYDROUS [Cocos nucifera]